MATCTTPIFHHLPIWRHRNTTKTGQTTQHAEATQQTLVLSAPHKFTIASINSKVKVLCQRRGRSKETKGSGYITLHGIMDITYVHVRCRFLNIRNFKKQNRLFRVYATSVKVLPEAASPNLLHYISGKTLQPWHGTPNTALGQPNMA